MTTKQPNYDLRPATRDQVLALFQQHHGYKSLGKSLTYCFAVREKGVVVAAFVWQPPMVGAAKAVCPELPSSVLALSRMVAVPRHERQLNHISKPLRRQMRNLIDRGRWPALVTYSDAGQGHTGHVYKCSGWQKTATSRRPYYVDKEGSRRSPYANGKKVEGLIKRGTTVLTRWEHWICPPEQVKEYMNSNGWRHVDTGQRWRSGNPRKRWVKR